MKTWMEEITQNAWRVVLSRARSHINTVWRLDVLPEYEQNLKNRYPLYKRSSRDVTVADFGHFFGEEGAIDTFFKNYLSPFVNTRRKHWILRPLEGQNLPVSNATLNLFQRSRNIREMYFTAGGKQPLLPFSLRPVELDRSISRFSLDIDGQHVTYRHGPTRWQKLQWPGPDGTNQSRISFEASSGSMQSKSTDGQWSWFRMLDKSKLRPSSHADKMKLTFTINKLSAKYELRGNSIMNPFRLQLLSKFRAPGNL
jgi:type VI secretion system protein ImpL